MIIQPIVTYLAGFAFFVQALLGVQNSAMSRIDYMSRVPGTHYDLVDTPKYDTTTDKTCAVFALYNVDPSGSNIGSARVAQIKCLKGQATKEQLASAEVNGTAITFYDNR